MVKYKGAFLYKLCFFFGDPRIRRVLKCILVPYIRRLSCCFGVSQCALRSVLESRRPGHLTFESCRTSSVVHLLHGDVNILYNLYTYTQTEQRYVQH